MRHSKIGDLALELLDIVLQRGDDLNNFALGGHVERGMGGRTACVGYKIGRWRGRSQTVKRPFILRELAILIAKVELSPRIDDGEEDEAALGDATGHKLWIASAAAISAEPSQGHAQENTPKTNSASEEDIQSRMT